MARTTLSRTHSLPYALSPAHIHSLPYTHRMGATSIRYTNCLCAGGAQRLHMAHGRGVAGVVPPSGCAAEDSLWPAYTGGVDAGTAAGPSRHAGPLKKAKYVDLTHAFSPATPAWPGFGPDTVRDLPCLMRRAQPFDG